MKLDPFWLRLCCASLSLTTIAILMAIWAKISLNKIMELGIYFTDGQVDQIDWEGFERWKNLLNRRTLNFRSLIWIVCSLSVLTMLCLVISLPNGW